MHKRKNVAVIGSGVTGLLGAYYLAKEGHDITVYEEEEYSGMKCSYSNGGQIGVSNSETWHSWSNVVKGIKWLAKKDAPLLIRPSLDIDRAKWLCGFLLNTARGVREVNTIKTIIMGLESRELYKQISVEEGINFDFKQSGILHFYRDEKYFSAAKAVQDMYENHGCEWKILTPNEVLQIEPTLENYSVVGEKIIGGIWTPSDWVGDIHKFCIELEKVLISKYKVIFRKYNHINRFRLESLSALYDSVVISAGVDSKKLANVLGDPCTIYPVKGYSVTIQCCGTTQLPGVSLLDDQSKIVSSTFGSRLRIAGTAELAGYNYDIRMDRVKPLLNWVNKHLEHVDTSDYRAWACLRPMTSNMLPMVCKSNRPGYYYHTGHGHLGWTISPSTAKQLVNLIKST